MLLTIVNGAAFMTKRFTLALAALLLPAAPASAATFLIEGTATGGIYSFQYGTCGQPWEACEVFTPESRSFSFVVPNNSGIYNAVTEGPVGIFSFVAAVPQLWSSQVTGTFRRAGAGYLGTSILAQSFYQCTSNSFLTCGSKFSATSFSVTDLDNPAVPTIPEPSTWAMLIAGLATVGGALRLRRKYSSLALA